LSNRKRLLFLALRVALGAMLGLGIVTTCTGIEEVGPQRKQAEAPPPEPRFVVASINSGIAHWSYYIRDNDSGAEFLVFCRDGCAMAQLPAVQVVKEAK
jgi:hypothetical protein